MIPSVRAKENACGQSFRLRHGLGFDDLVFQQLAHDRTGSVIAQTSGVNVRRVEVVSQRIHREQRSEACHVAEVVLELTARQLGTRLGFDGDYAGIFTFGQVIAQEREADARRSCCLLRSNRSPRPGTPRTAPSVSRPPRR